MGAGAGIRGPLARPTVTVVLRERWESWLRWRARLGAELSSLPDTLRNFREGTANFQLVSERLARATERLEALSGLYDTAGAGEAVRRLEEAAAAMQRQRAALVANTPGLDLVGSAVDEFARAVASLAELNPFFRRPGGPKPSA
jgi:hypothetical protein